MRSENGSTRILAIAATLENVDKLSKPEFLQELESALLKEMKEERNQPMSWILKNFTSVVTFFQENKLTSNENIKILHEFFDVSLHII